MTTKHTQGPWEFPGGRVWPNNGAPVFATRDGQRTLVAEVNDLNNYNLDPEVAANARLITAAPELLEACRKAGEFLDNLPLKGEASAERYDLTATIEEVIAKAEGRG
jgi:hypothetical protein